MPRQIPFDAKKTTFIEGSPAAYGALYFNSKDIDQKILLSAMVRSLLAPLGAAQSGLSASEVEALIESSNRIHAQYMEFARGAIVVTPKQDPIVEDPVDDGGLGPMSEGEDLGDLFG